MSPTTLVTFRIRAPATTRTLHLYGSWDNFTIGYNMSKDLQRGSEYWSGCFNFSNIICDGKPSETLTSRNGGLRMGGTYWYYYKLDDVTDFHNVCERATTTCPLMPGQLVNVLHVPYAFSGNRSRDPSTSSTSSERRTMNPHDKFENPRPVPAMPDILRVSTSPICAELSKPEEGLHSKEAPRTGRFLRLPRKASIDSFAGPSPSSLLAGGLRAAFKIRTARSKSPDVKSPNRVRDHTRAVSTERSPNLEDSTFVRENPDPLQIGLLFRSASDESVSTLSFARHRREVRRSVASINESDFVIRQPVELPILTLPNRPQLATLKERISGEVATDIEMQSKVPPTESHIDLEKRLPTLPNTPSSAYPASLSTTSPPRYCAGPKLLESHFSATTIDTEYQPLSMAINGQSHFSAWTTTSIDTSSGFFGSSAPLPPDDGKILAFQQEHKNRLPSEILPSANSPISVSSSLSSSRSTSYLDLDSEFEYSQTGTTMKSQARGYSEVPQCSLPEDAYTSQTTLKAISVESLPTKHGKTDFLAVAIPETRDNEILHSEGMRQLLEELSYLSDIIQQ